MRFHDQCGLRLNGRKQLREKLLLKRFWRETARNDFVFEFLELFGEETLGTDRSLLALIVRRSVLEMSLGDFDVVTEDAVVTDFERGNSSRFALAGLEIDQPLLAVFVDVDKRSSSALVPI